jgi:hypothetical protein
VRTVTRYRRLTCAVAVFSLVSALAGAATASAATGVDGVTAKLVLASRRVPAGTPLRGTLVLTNPGDRTVDLNQGCAPQWDVVLGRGRTPPQVAFTMECSPEPFRVAPGSTQRKFRVDTAGKRAGAYRVFLVASQPSFPEAKPVKVRVVRAR